MEVFVGYTIKIRINTGSALQAGETASINIKAPSGTVTSLQATIDPNDNRVIEANFVPQEPGNHLLQAVITDTNGNQYATQIGSFSAIQPVA